MTPLCELAIKYHTDKCSPHQYTPVYYRLLGEKTETISRVLEIGIGKRGGSLRMWEEFFPNAEIFGIDINPDYLFNVGRIKTFFGNQAKGEKLARLATKLGGNFDIIVDDGNHTAEKQISALHAMLPFLKLDGIYFIEDIKDGGVTRIRSMMPLGYKFEVYEGGKLLPSGRGERLMIIQRND